MNNQTITGGFDWYKDELPHYQGTYLDMMGQELPIADLEGKSITTTAFYIQDQWDINEKWSLTPGVRVDHNSQFGTHTSPSLSVGYDVLRELERILHRSEPVPAVSQCLWGSES